MMHGFVGCLVMHDLFAPSLSHDRAHTAEHARAITGDGTSSPKANPIVDNTAMPRTDFFTLLISVSSLSVLDC